MSEYMGMVVGGGYLKLGNAVINVSLASHLTWDEGHAQLVVGNGTKETRWQMTKDQWQTFQLWLVEGKVARGEK